MMKNLPKRVQIHPILSIFILSGLAIPMAFYGMYLYLSPALPNMSNLQKAPLEQPLQIYTNDNILIAEFGERLSLPVKYKEIPPDLIHAFLAAEDSSFFEHNGVSFKGLGRAVSETLSGGAQTGGSTITMQVAKNYYLTPERTLRRKLTEIFLARKMEENLTKEEILTLYVNKIFLGKNAYGVQAAARVYYDKTLDQLTLAEKAMIAGLPKAPSKYNPSANPERALERRNWILGRMLQLGYINQKQYTTASREPIQLKLNLHNKVEEKFPYLAEMVRHELVARFGEGIMNSGLKVYSTVDSERQALAEKAVRSGLEAYDRRHGWRGAEAHDKPLTDFRLIADMHPALVTKISGSSFEATLKDGKTITVPWSGMNWVHLYRNVNNPGPAAGRVSQIVSVGDIVRVRPNAEQTAWQLTQIPNVQGQLIALNPNSGAIQAVVGGFDFYQSKFNRSIQGFRQPGSTIKPFIYSLALERGLTPYSTVNDAPISIGKWHPKNSDGRYLGMIPLRRALYLSRNTVSVRLLQTVGLERARQLMIDIGIHPDQIPKNYTIALGTPQALPIQMATGYAVFANGGYRIQPYAIDHILDGNGQSVFKANPVYACIPCINPEQPKQEDMSIETAEKLVNQQLKGEATTTQNPPTETKPESQTPQSTHPILGQYRQAPRILKASSAYDMANILRDVIVHGTGRAALKIGRDDLGGKTGTTNDAKDAWFSGFNANLVTITWVGFDNPRSLGRREYGGVAALPIWIDFMAGALKDQPSAWVKDKDDSDENNQSDEKTIRDDLTQEDNTPDNRIDLRRQQKAIPPLARPLYQAPIVVRLPSTKKSDFADLNDDEDQPPQKKPSNNTKETPLTPKPVDEPPTLDPYAQ